MKQRMVFWGIGVLGIAILSISFSRNFFAVFSRSEPSLSGERSSAAITELGERYAIEDPSERGMIEAFYREYGDAKRVDEYFKNYGILASRAFAVLGVNGLRFLNDSQVREAFSQCLKKERYLEYKPILEKLTDYLQDCKALKPERIARFFHLLSQLNANELLCIQQNAASLPLLLVDPDRGRELVGRYGSTLLEILYQFSPESYGPLLQAFANNGDQLLEVYRLGQKEGKAREYVDLYGVEFASIAQVVYSEADRLFRGEYQREIQTLEMPEEILSQQVNARLVSDTLFFLLKNYADLRRQRCFGNEEGIAQEIRRLCDYNLFRVALRVPHAYQLFCETPLEKREQTRKFLEQTGEIGGPVFLYSQIADINASLRHDIISGTLQYGLPVLLAMSRLWEEGLSPHTVLQKLKVDSYKMQFLHQIAGITIDALQARKNLREAVTGLLQEITGRGDDYYRFREDRENRSLIWDYVPGYEALHLITILSKGYSPGLGEACRGALDGVNVVLFTVQVGSSVKNVTQAVLKAIQQGNIDLLRSTLKVTETVSTALLHGFIRALSHNSMGLIELGKLVLQDFSLQSAEIPDRAERLQISRFLTDRKARELVRKVAIDTLRYTSAEIDSQIQRQLAQIDSSALQKQGISPETLKNAVRQGDYPAIQRLTANHPQLYEHLARQSFEMQLLGHSQESLQAISEAVSRAKSIENFVNILENRVVKKSAAPIVSSVKYSNAQGEISLRSRVYPIAVETTHWRGDGQMSHFPQSLKGVQNALSDMRFIIDTTDRLLQVVTEG